MFNAIDACHKENTVKRITHDMLRSELELVMLKSGVYVRTTFATFLA